MSIILPKPTTECLSRATGPFAILAGVIFAGIQPIHPPDFLASVTTMPWAVIMTLKFLMCLFFIVATLGIYSRQVEKSGWIGLVGAVAFGLSWWLQTGYVFAELVILPPLAAASPEFVDSFLGIVNQHPGALDIGISVALYGVLGLLYLSGGILFGIATLRSGTFPRTPSALLVIAAIITPAAAMLPHEFQRYAAIPMGVAFVWLGVALWFPQRLSTPLADAAAQSA